MTNAKNIAQIFAWLAVLGLATLALGVVLDAIKAQVRA